MVGLTTVLRAIVWYVDYALWGNWDEAEHEARIAVEDTAVHAFIPKRRPVCLASLVLDTWESGWMKLKQLVRSVQCSRMGGLSEHQATSYIWAALELLLREVGVS